MESFVAIDFETANGNRTSICSVGMVRVENKLIIDSFYQLIKPVPNYYNPMNIQVHGINYHDTIEKESFPEVWIKMKNFMGELPLVAHNKSFDQGCLNAILNHHNLPIPKNLFYCTVSPSRKFYPNLPNHKLSTLAKYLNVPLDHHNALSDAIACAKIAIEVL
jgi:DNA polymerase-3 subunit epsilon